MTRCILKTTDGIDIVADYYLPKTPSTQGVLLVHMMPATRVSWKMFATHMQEKGYHVLAIDLRGHGESTGGPEGYKQFNDEDHQKSSFDLETAGEFLKTKGVEVDHLSLVGASIGANLVLQYGALRGAKNIILLSPGLSYRGIKADPLVQKIKQGTRILFVASQDDDRSDGNNAETTQLLFDRTSESVEKKIILYREAGHGTEMFDKEEPDLEEEIMTWLAG